MDREDQFELLLGEPDTREEIEEKMKDI
jgi:hypothetical protein